MVGKTLTRAKLSELIYQEVGISKTESMAILDLALDKISSALVSGEPVKISSFGTFSVRSKGLRTGRNPKTGQEVPIMPRRVLAFRPSQVLKDRVSGIYNSADPLDRD